METYTLGRVDDGRTDRLDRFHGRCLRKCAEDLPEALSASEGSGVWVAWGVVGWGRGMPQENFDLSSRN
ncbi:uncharacterized protein A4U43_C08F16230, partial [Asparagus officinalis]